MAQDISMASTQRSSWNLTGARGISGSLPEQRAGVGGVQSTCVSSYYLLSNGVQETLLVQQMVMSTEVQKTAMETVLMTTNFHLPTQSGTMPQNSQVRLGSVNSQGRSLRGNQWMVLMSHYQMTPAENRDHLANVIVANSPALLLRGLNQVRQ